MSRSLRAQWFNAAVLAGVVVAFLVINGDELSSPVGWIVPVVFTVLAVAASPLRSPPTRSHAEAAALVSDATAGDRSRAADGPPVVIYHRPGCTFCARLKLVLTGVRSRALWVDIWQDPEAAAFVRSANEGNETVPTVILDGRPHTNPNPLVVRRALSR